MIQQVDAVYEHGVLHPLQPLSLTELQRVRIIISDAAPGVSQRWIESLLSKEVRAALATIPGSISHNVIADRGDY
jgi:predicted DNA-binding antitoxin AbrB/MazE fold protein